VEAEFYHYLLQEQEQNMFMPSRLLLFFHSVHEQTKKATKTVMWCDQYHLLFLERQNFSYYYMSKEEEKRGRICFFDL
jgi:hypothetical protein